MIKSAAELNDLRKALAEDVPEGMATRLHRAIRWLERAERETSDPDVQFILYWIAFNALYADDLNTLDVSFHGRTYDFFAKLIALDTDMQLRDLMWTTFSQSVRTLLDNKYAYKGFWNALRSGADDAQWEKAFEHENRRALVGLRDGITVVVLDVVFGRLYTLRNQLVHGGSTHNSSVNRYQINDGARILSAVVPVMLELMLANPMEDFGEIAYPVVG